MIHVIVEVLRSIKTVVVLYRLVLFFLFYNFLSFSLISKEKEEIFKKLNITFRYGVNSEVSRALNLYNDNHLKGEDKGRYIDSLKILLNEKLLNYDINFKIFNIIKKYKLESFYGYFQDILDELMEDEESILSTSDIRLLNILLDSVVQLDIRSYLSTFSKMLEDKDKRYEEKGIFVDNVISILIRGIREFKGVLSSEKLKEMFEEYKGGATRQEIIHSISENKNTADISYLQDLLDRGDVGKVVKWVIIVQLKEYGNNSDSIAILQNILEEGDKDSRLRAIYTLSFVLPKVEGKELFLINIRDDDPSVRVQALKMTLQLKGDKEIIELLKYKRDNDPSVNVKKKAGDILKEMGIDEEE